MKQTHVLAVAGSTGPARNVVAWLRAECPVTEAEDFPVALRTIEDEEPDLVLVEVSPGTAGTALSFVRHFKAGSRGLYTPLLTMTAEATLRDRLVSNGVDDCFLLPIDRADLLLRVKAFARIREQERLLRAQVEQLARLSELKDDLVSLLVHDLRNPLSGVRAILEAMSVRGDTPYAAEIDAALRGADRIEDALEDLLRVRQLEEDRLPVQREPHRVSELIDTVAEAFRGASVGRDVQLVVSGDRSLVVQVDGPLVERAIENLLGNALRYAPRRSVVELHVGALGSEVELLVRDRGPGIPATVRQHLFQKFGQVGSRPAGDRPGFGLGLYLVNLVASAHGGRVWASDREGGGAVFHLILPGPTPDDS